LGLEQPTNTGFKQDGERTEKKKKTKKVFLGL